MLECAANSTGLVPNNCVRIGIEILWSAQEVDPDEVRLQFIGPSCQAFLDHEVQEPAETFRTQEVSTAQ